MGLPNTHVLTYLRIKDNTSGPSGAPAAGYWWFYMLNDILTLEDEAGATYDVVTRTATQTLTNKTLTSPAINTATIAGGTVNNAAIGGTTAAAGKFTTLENTGAYIHNEAGADVDARWEGDNNANLLFLDASTDRMGVGTPTPATLLDVNGDVTVKGLLFAANTELTIASGAVTATQGSHTIDTEADAASDDLDTINGGSANEILFIRADNTARTVVVTTAGNIVTPTGSSISLDETYKMLMVKYDAGLSKWIVLYHTSGGVGSYYQTFEDEGVAVTQRANVNFTGAGVSVADSGGKTVVTIPGGSGAMTQISKSVLSGTAANFDLTSISGSYTILVLYAMLHSDYASSVFDVAKITFNNDTGANYLYQRVSGAASTASAASASGQTSININAQGDNGTTTHTVICRIEIPFYSETTFLKQAMISAWLPYNATQKDEWGAEWNSTAAITRITIAPRDGSNWKIGSAAALYGIT